MDPILSGKGVISGVCSLTVDSTSAMGETKEEKAPSHFSKDFGDKQDALFTLVSGLKELTVILRDALTSGIATQCRKGIVQALVELESEVDTGKRKPTASLSSEEADSEEGSEVSVSDDEDQWPDAPTSAVPASLSPC